MTPSFGRIVDSEHTEAFIARQASPFASQAMQWSGDDNADVFLPDIYEKVTGKKWDSMNQNPRGICVGMGWAKSMTMTLAVMAYLGKITYPGEVHPAPIYGAARYEIGYQKYGNRIRGSRSNPDDDGAVGSWAGEWCSERGGILLMKKYPEYDLSVFDPVVTASQFGYDGVPDVLEDDAKVNTAQQVTLCQHSGDVWAFIGQLYAINVCSSQGFSYNRNSRGICEPTGTWLHCMWYAGRVTIGGERYIIIDNSWDGRRDGSGYLGGTLTITTDSGNKFTLTGNMFLVRMNVIDAMCTGGSLSRRSNQRETFAIAGGIGGFPMQRELFSF